MKRILVAVVAVLALAPSVATAEPKQQLLTAPYREMFRYREYCPSPSVSNCAHPDEASTWDGSLSNSFRVTGVTSGSDSPIRQLMDVGFWMPAEVGSYSANNAPTVTVTYHLESASFEQHTLDAGPVSHAAASLWASVEHGGCGCLVSSAEGEPNPSVEIFTSQDGSLITIPEQDVILEFTLDHLPGTHLAASSVLIRVGLRSEAVLNGTGSLEGSVIGSLTSVAIS